MQNLIANCVYTKGLLYSVLPWSCPPNAEFPNLYHQCTLLMHDLPACFYEHPRISSVSLLWCHVTSRSASRVTVLVTGDEAMPWIRPLVTSLLPWRPRFSCRPLCVEFLGDNMELGEVLLWVAWFSTGTIIPPMLHTHSSITSTI